MIIHILSFKKKVDNGGVLLRTNSNVTQKEIGLHIDPHNCKRILNSITDVRDTSEIVYETEPFVKTKKPAEDCSPHFVVIINSNLFFR